jgi:glutamyl-tRNA synthetase
MKKDWNILTYNHALKNAIEHNGKAISSSVLSSLFQEGLKKHEIKKIMPLIEEAMKKVNIMTHEQQLHDYNQISSKLKPKKREEKKARHKIKKVGKVITRLAPEPSKYNHIGHALSFILNYIYAKENKGKCYLRFEDTNPEKESQEYVNSMKEDILNYLGIKPNQIKFVSDDMIKLYGYADKLVKSKNAYVCFCLREKIKELREKGIECSCREKDEKQNMIEWQRMKRGIYAEGEATLRIRGDMQNMNYVMRDSVIFRIVSKEHFRQKNKYSAWPMYDFYNPIEDSVMGVTHVLRSNEFEVRTELHNYLKKLLNLKNQEIIQYGRFNVIGTTTKGREILELIKSGKYLGWDDPRLVTLVALKRRGIVKETFYELANQIGMSKNEAHIDFNMIASINRKIIDKKSNRYSFILDPVIIEIKNIPKIKDISIKLHPEGKKSRKVKIGNKIIISKEDLNKNIGKEIRLMHLYNIKVGKNKSKFTSIENKDIPKINWVSKFIKAKILMDDGNWKEGYADEGIKKLKKGEIIQFERFGFVRFDNINKKKEYEFYFAHR